MARGDSEREAAPSETEKPDGEDNEVDNADIVDGRARHIRTLLEPFSGCTQGEKVAGKGGFALYKGQLDHRSNA